MKFKVLSSGSKGNLTYIESNEAKILLDAGISLKEINRRSNIDMDEIDAILVTHSHSDHVGFLMPILKKTRAVLYITKETFEEYVNKYDNDYSKIRVQFIEINKKYKIKDINFMPLIMSHDVYCVGYIFASGNDSLGYATDTGFISLPYIDLFKKVDSLIIEANHDIEMLQNSDRHPSLKQRILSIKGHMSNLICGEILNKILDHKYVKLIVLAHISEDCNDERIAIDTVMDAIKGDYIPQVLIAKQRESIPMYDCKGNMIDED